MGISTKPSVPLRNLVKYLQKKYFVADANIGLTGLLRAGYTTVLDSTDNRYGGATDYTTTISWPWYNTGVRITGITHLTRNAPASTRTLHVQNMYVPKEGGSIILHDGTNDEVVDVLSVSASGRIRLDAATTAVAYPAGTLVIAFASGSAALTQSCDLAGATGGPIQAEDVVSLLVGLQNEMQHTADTIVADGGTTTTITKAASFVANAEVDNLVFLVAGGGGTNDGYYARIASNTAGVLVLKDIRDPNGNFVEELPAAVVNLDTFRVVPDFLTQYIEQLAVIGRGFNAVQATAPSDPQFTAYPISYKDGGNAGQTLLTALWRYAQQLGRDTSLTLSMILEHLPDPSVDINVGFLNAPSPAYKWYPLQETIADGGTRCVILTEQRQALEHLPESGTVGLVSGLSLPRVIATATDDTGGSPTVLNDNAAFSVTYKGGIVNITSATDPAILGRHRITDATANTLTVPNMGANTAVGDTYEVIPYKFHNTAFTRHDNVLTLAAGTVGEYVAGDTRAYILDMPLAKTAYNPEGDKFLLQVLMNDAVDALNDYVLIT